MSGGGASQVSSSTPWGPAQPYLTDIMGKGQSLYGSLAPNFSTPSANFNYGAETNAVGNALTGQPDYTATQNAIEGANSQQWNDFYNNVIPQLNSRASFMQNPTGAIKDLNSAITNMGRNQSWNADQLMLGQYDNALQRQLQAASMFPSVSQLPFAPLNNYADLISQTGGRFGNGSLSMNPGSSGTIANVLGGLLAGGGVYNSLFPSNGSGLGNAVVGGLGKLFGGNQNAAGGSTALTDAASNYLYTGDSTYGIPGIDGSSDPNSGAYTDLSNADLASLFGFDGAGGQAAATDSGGSAGAVPSASSSPGLGDLNGAYGAYTGLTSGNPVGEAGGAINAAQLANKAGVFGNASGAAGSALGAAGAALGAYAEAQHGDQNGGYIPAAANAANAVSLASGNGAIAGLGPMGLAMGAVMALDAGLNGDEAATSQGMNAQIGVNQSQQDIYKQLLSAADQSNPEVQAIQNPRFSGGWGTGALTGIYYANPLQALSDLMGRNAAGTAGNSTVQNMLNQTVQGISPNNLFTTLQTYAQQGVPVGAGGWGITAQELYQAGLTSAQIQQLGVA